MMNVYNDTSSSIYVVGDLHGNFNDLMAMLKRYELKDISVIVAGDCGFGFSTVDGDKYALSKLKRYCEQNKVIVYFVRGNHDDPSYFKNKVINTDVFKCVPDYSIIRSLNKETGELKFTVLCVGGATSIDRVHRINKYQDALVTYMRYHNGDEQKALENVRKFYWEDEQPVYDEEALNELHQNGVRFDYVVTHTCPSMCEPNSKNGLEEWMKHDSTLSEDLDKERKTMDKLLSWLLNNNDNQLKKWVYGHFHYRNFDTINGVDYIMLDASYSGGCDMYELKRNEQ